MARIIGLVLAFLVGAVVLLVVTHWLLGPVLGVLVTLVLLIVALVATVRRSRGASR